MRNGCQPAGPAGGGGSSSGNGGSGAGRQSATASFAAFVREHPEAAVVAATAGGAFLLSEIRATRSELSQTRTELRSELRSELSQTRSELQRMERRINGRMDRLYHALIGRSGAPSGEAAPGDASGDDDDD